MSIKRVTAPGASFVCRVREDQVTGERGLDGDLRRLQIAHFADHDAVRVLPQEGAEDAGEGQADRFVHRHLHDAVEVVLDRFLGGQQLGVDRVDLSQAANRAWSSCRNRSGR